MVLNLHFPVFFPVSVLCYRFCWAAISVSGIVESLIEVNLHVGRYFTKKGKLEVERYSECSGYLRGGIRDPKASR